MTIFESPVQVGRDRLQVQRVFEVTVVAVTESSGGPGKMSGTLNASACTVESDALELALVAGIVLPPAPVFDVIVPLVKGRTGSVAPAVVTLICPPVVGRNPVSETRVVISVPKRVLFLFLIPVARPL